MRIWLACSLALILSAVSCTPASDEAPPGEPRQPISSPTEETVESDDERDPGESDDPDPDPTYLQDVRVAGHTGFDRVVLELDGSDEPEFRASYVDPPVQREGSGSPVSIEGRAFLKVQVWPASAVDEDGDETYEGATRIEPPDTDVVTEVVRTGDSDDTLTWVVGVNRRSPVAADFLRDPIRLVVDIVPETYDPVGHPDTTTVQSEDFPTGGGETVFLTDVRVGAHNGFDRVVLEFDGTDPPSHRIGYVEPPVREDGSGREVEVEGPAYLEIRLSPATGFDARGEQAVETYEGAKRIPGPGTEAVNEVVRTGDFERHLTWVVGVSSRAPFAMAFFEDPLRLVVDIVPTPTRRIGERTTGPVQSEGFPGEGETSYLDGVRLGLHSSFDRVVFAFRGDRTPSYRVRYVDPPIREQPSGREMEMEGEAYLEVSMHPASGIDMTGDEPQETYEGADRIQPDTTEVIEEAARTTDHHRGLSWVIGLQHWSQFAVGTLSDPPRIVVDVMHDEAPSSSPSPTPESPSMVGEPSHEPRQTEDFPDGGGSIAYLSDVRAGGHGTFDRVVLEFETDDRPSYRVQYVEGPVREDGSGREMSVEGEAYLEVRLSPASATERTDEGTRESYDGPRRFRPAGTEAVLEVAQRGDHEGSLAWVVGLPEELPFAVVLFENPLRLVLDIQHP